MGGLYMFEVIHTMSMTNALPVNKVDLTPPYKRHEMLPLIIIDPTSESFEVIKITCTKCRKAKKVAIDKLPDMTEGLITIAQAVGWIVLANENEITFYCSKKCLLDAMDEGGGVDE